MALLQLKTKQNIFIIMPNTPQKPSNASTEPSSLLKVAIEQKLAVKDAKTYEQAKQTTEPFEVLNDELHLLQQIQSYESKTDPGYYRYENWMNFNAQIFGRVNEQTVCNLWKILRIINHGEVAIPAGLVYQISNYFFLKESLSASSSEHGTLKEVINEFLRMNKTKQFVNNFRELSNYPKLQDIQKQYCPHYYKNLKSNSFKTAEKMQPGKQLYDRLHKDGRRREQSIRQQKYASMAKQLSQCKFTPNINSYKSKTQLKICQRICKHPHPQPAQEKQPIHKFVARQIDKKIYQGAINHVPGAQAHIKRAVFSQAERQRIKRLTSRTWLMIR